MNSSVVVVDDHDIVRFGIESLVRQCASFNLVGSAGSLEDGLALVRQFHPDIVITDLGLGDSSGLDTVHALVEAQQDRAVLVVSMQDEMLYGEQVLRAGACGYLMKETAQAHLIDAIRTVLAGDTWTSPQLHAALMNRMLRRSRPAARPGELGALTRRELQVLEMLRGGRTTKQIATALNLSIRTVDIHRASIKRKLGLRSGAEVIAFASQHLS